MVVPGKGVGILLTQAEIQHLSEAYSDFWALRGAVNSLPPPTEQAIADAGKAVAFEFNGLKAVYDAKLAAQQKAADAEVAQLKADVIGSLTHPNWVPAGNIEALAQKYSGMSFAALCDKIWQSQFSTTVVTATDQQLSLAQVDTQTGLNADGTQNLYWTGINVRR